MTHPLLFEINTRCWLRWLSTRRHESITLANVPESEIDAWHKLGFTHIWAMGVWTTGPLCRAQALENRHLQETFTKILPGWSKHDVAGSPYAIAAYEVPAALGGNEGLQIFRNQLHARGMKLLLDFVPNHLGLDHPWVAARPELFMQSAAQAPGTFQQTTGDDTRWFAHGKDPHFPPWSDTVQLDYRRSDTRKAMIELLRSVARQCDGVRCDMAMLLLNEVFQKTWADFPHGVPSPVGEFWSDAIGAVRQDEREFIFLAEAYWGLEPKLQGLGFDYTYDKQVYDRLVERNYPKLQKQLLAEPHEVLARGVHFLENHDERRAAAVFSPEEHRAAALLTLGLPGMRMIYEGQLRGARLQVPVHLARWPDELVDEKIAAIYQQLFAVLKNSAVGRGEFHLLAPENTGSDGSAENFVAIQWQNSSDQFDLVIVNFADKPGRCRLRPVAVDLASHDWQITGLFGTENRQSHGGDLEAQGLSVVLPAHGTQLLRFQTPV